VSTAPQLVGETSSGRRVWSANPPQLSIDPNGNLIQKIEGNDTWTYEWNAEDLLRRVLLNGSEVARYSYDPLGRRVEKVAGGVTTTFTYDVEAILRAQISGGATLTYIHSPELDEPLASEDQNGVRTNLHADGLGSIVTSTNASGTVTSTLKYDAFGVIETGTPARYSYTGREWEPESKLYYYRARYLDPKGGRFLSENPLGFDDGPNFYAYVANNPVRFVDPWGLKKIVICQKQKSLTLYDDDGKPMMNADVVCGCKESSTPDGTFTAGPWQKNKTNPKFSGPKGWEQDPWGNPYGPWFLPINGSNGCGIHGTRGYAWMGDTFIDMPFTCSHGCVRMSNPNIVKMHQMMPKSKGTQVVIKDTCE